MFDSNKTLNRTIQAPTNVYTVLSSELERMHKLFNAERGNDNTNNINIYWKCISEIQNTLIECAKKGADEELKARVDDLQKHVAEQILTGVID